MPTGDDDATTCADCEIAGKPDRAPRPADRAYRADIDGLRAIAVVAVILYHAHLRQIGGGFVGVDIFFVISGYLITGILIEDARIGPFYLRRIRRILPALLTMLLLTSAAAFALLLPHDLTQFCKSALATLGFSSNLWFWRQSGYFAPASAIQPLLHTWSLGVEEQFYIVFPLVLLLVRRLGHRNLRLVLAGLALLSFAGAQYLIELSKANIAFYLMPPRAWELLAGAVLAFPASETAVNRTIRGLLAAAALVVIAGAFVFLRQGMPFPGALALPPVLAAALLIWAGRGQGHGLTGALSWPPLVWLGRISYSLYLWHWPLLAFARYYAIGPLGWAWTAAALAASVVLAALSWRFVEQPFRRRFSNRVVVGVAASGTALVALVAAAAVAAGGFPGRFEARVATLNASEMSNYKCPASDYRPFGDYYACPIGPGARGVSEARVVVWGDSHAQMYVPAIAAALGERPGLLVPVNACAPMLGFNSAAECARLNGRNFALIRAMKARTVVMALNWDAYADAPLVDAAGRQATARDFDLTLAQLGRTIAALRAAGKTVVVVGPVAVPGYDVASVVSRAWAFGRALDLPLSGPPPATQSRFRPVYQALAQWARDPGVVVVRPDARLCGPDACAYIQGGRSLFGDTGHLTAPAAASLAPLFAAALARDPPARAG